MPEYANQLNMNDPVKSLTQKLAEMKLRNRNRNLERVRSHSRAKRAQSQQRAQPRPRVPPSPRAKPSVRRQTFRSRSPTPFGEHKEEIPRRDIAPVRATSPMSVPRRTPPTPRRSVSIPRRRLATPPSKRKEAPVPSKRITSRSDFSAANLMRRFRGLITMFGDPDEKSDVISIFQEELSSKKNRPGGLESLAIQLNKLERMDYQDRYDAILDWLTGIPTFEEITGQAEEKYINWGLRFFNLYKRYSPKPWTSVEDAQAWLDQYPDQEHEVIRMAERKYNVPKLGVRWEDTEPPRIEETSEPRRSISRTPPRKTVFRRSRTPPSERKEVSIPEEPPISRERRTPSVARIQRRPTQIKLFESQVEHYDNIVNILSTNVAYIDTSPTGSGKSYTTAKYAQEKRLTMFVVSPKSVIPIWENIAEIFGIDLEIAMSYATLIGRKGRFSHDYLTKKSDGYYAATDTLIELVNTGTLFVFDEMHNVKNTGSQLNSSHAIVRAVVEASESESRVALLSATPGEKKEHAKSIVKMLGITTQDVFAIYDKSTKIYDGLGILDVINEASDINRQETRRLVRTRTYNNTGVIEICFTLYVNIFKERLCTSIADTNLKDKLDAKSGYYNMYPEDIESIKEGAKELQKVFVVKKSKSVVGLTTALKTLEHGKFATMIRLALQKLREDPKAQVILYFWFIDSIEAAAEDLEDHNPLILYGQMDSEQRLDVEAKFQANNSQYRLLIAQPKVGGVGISLDDRYGDRPRWIFLVPTYYFSDLIQAQGRVARKSTVGKGHVRYVYSQAFPEETKILNNIVEKSKIAKELRCNVLEDERVYPGDFEKWYEPSHISADIPEL